MVFACVIGIYKEKKEKKNKNKKAGSGNRNTCHGNLFYFALFFIIFFFFLSFFLSLSSQLSLVLRGMRRPRRRGVSDQYYYYVIIISLSRGGHESSSFTQTSWQANANPVRTLQLVRSYFLGDGWDYPVVVGTNRPTTETGSESYMRDTKGHEDPKYREGHQHVGSLSYVPRDPGWLREPG